MAALVDYLGARDTSGDRDGVFASTLCALARALALLGTGCASFRAAPSGPGREVRPDAPAEYDVLVFHEHLADGRPQEAIAALERAIEKDESRRCCTG